MKQFITDQERQQIADWDKFLLIDKINKLAERVAKLESQSSASKPTTVKK